MEKWQKGVLLHIIYLVPLSDVSPAGRLCQSDFSLSSQRASHLCTGALSLRTQLLVLLDKSQASLNMYATRRIGQGCCQGPSTVDRLLPQLPVCLLHP